MSEQAELFWLNAPRAATAYAERADANETAADRALLELGARVRGRLGRSPLARAAEVAARIEREQREVDRLTDAELRAAADELRPLLMRRGFAPDLAARAFALVRAAAARTLGLRHFAVQLMGGYVMLEGMLAEMETGEGKTLTATLPAATAALAGLPVHVVTVNEYLAQRDGEWMRPVYAALGLTVGVAQHGQKPEERRQAYAADIAYCTNKDLGFDYLRDRLALEARRGRGRLLLEQLLGRGDRLGRLLLRGLHFAIVDEADSVLIDEARTPLIISGTEESGSDEALYAAALGISRRLDAADYVLEPLSKAVRLTERGRARVAEMASALPAAWRSARAREELAQQGLAALHFYHLDRHYIVRDGKVQIVDEYTGRVLPDRSWERGLHQLVETKEGCKVTGRRTTLARITYQRLFRRYLRVCGMTGTASEVAPELEAVYGLRVVPIATNQPVRRRARGTRLYATREQKWLAVAASIAELRAAGRPVLIGTRSVAASEELSAVLTANGVEHLVLNARQDRDEAQIVARAGEAMRVTVATNMAGRGTDIKLAPEVTSRGGLHVILTEFHESGRIDRQLYGRCARQGDPGSYEVIVSLDDEILRKYAGGMSAFLASLYAERGSRPLPGWCARWLKESAQQSAERANAHDRRATLAQDRRLDQTLAFAGSAE